MKKICISLMLLIATVFSTTASFATNIGYIDFKKIGNEYTYAKSVYKEIDGKALELQQYLIDKDKQYKDISSPIAKKSFEEKTQAEFAQKRESLEKLQVRREEEIYNKVMAAAKVIANQKHLEAVFDQNAVFIGGTDITADVIRYLNSPQTTTK